jgi:hypothetical protein
VNEDSQQKNVDPVPPASDAQTTNSHSNNRSTQEKHACSTTYMILVFALGAQSFASTIVLVLWPLFLRDRYQFTAAEFGVAIFVTSLSTTVSIASFPTFERKFGASFTAAFCSLVAALSCLAGFVLLPYSSLVATVSRTELIEEHTSSQQVEQMMVLREFELVHIGLAILLQTSLLTLEPSLKSVFSLHVPPSVQGRSIGLMATIGGVGGMGGNLIGTYLYQASKDDSNNAARIFGGLSRHGRLPFLLVAILLGIASASIGLEWYHSKKSVMSEEEDAGIEVGLLQHPVVGSNDLPNQSQAVPCCGEIEEDDPDQDDILIQSQAATIGSLLHLETSYDLKLD